MKPTPMQSSRENAGLWPKLEKLYGGVIKSVAMLAGLIILTMVVLSLKELIMRNLGMPGSWTGETIEIMVMWTFLLPMAYSQLDGAMIRVTLLTDKLSPQVRFLVKSGPLPGIEFTLRCFLWDYTIRCQLWLLRQNRSRCLLS